MEPTYVITFLVVAIVITHRMERYFSEKAYAIQRERINSLLEIIEHIVALQKQFAERLNALEEKQ